ncbi:DUF7109 family protein [Haloferacaceae archaeon DSL9]
MTATQDELAGIVDLFGALSRTELSTALAELAFKQGREADEDALDAAIETARREYFLVEYDDGDRPLLAVGPTAFPSLPPNAEDLPHIMDVGSRSPAREALAADVVDRLDRDAAAAIEDGDAARAEFLYDVSYDAEAWGPIDAGGIRATLDPVLQD